MPNDFLSRFAIALLDYLAKRMEDTARDADADPEALRRAGDRLREWMRKPDDLRAGRESDEDWTG